MSQEEVKKEWEKKLRASFQNADALIGFMVNTMDSFAYRYLNEPALTHEGKTFLLEGREFNMGQALKTSHADIKEAVKQLAKSVPREQKPALVSRVRVDVEELTAEEGQLVVTAQVNWAHPDYAWANKQKFEKKKVLTWHDLTDFRKGFPLALEEVCDLFL